MRRKQNGQGMFEFTPAHRETVKRLEAMAGILDGLPGVLEAVHADLTRGIDSNHGRDGMSAEQVLRMAVVKQMEGWSYQVLAERVADSNALRKFCKYETGRVPQHAAIHANIQKVQPETMKQVHEALVAYAKKAGIENGEWIRADTTGIETNIHHPTDAALIWDGVRVVTLMLRSARNVFPGAGLDFRDRRRVVKKLAFKIATAKGEEERVSLYKAILGYGEEVVKCARDGIQRLKDLKGTEERRIAAKAVAEEIKEKTDLLARVIDQAKRRKLQKEQVPAQEKVVSLFEPHTDILAKGGRETVFGHKVSLTMGKSTLVLDAEITRGNPADATLFPGLLDRHTERFGCAPVVVATDGGFASAENANYAVVKGVEHIAFSKRTGKVLEELLPPEPIRRLLFKFRSGAEGVISGLKRGVGLGRCPLSGWDGFRLYVWTGLVAHNLKTLVAISLGKSKTRRWAFA